MRVKSTFWQHSHAGAEKHLGQLDTVCHIGRVLSAGPERDVLRQVLDVLETELGLSGGVLTLVPPDDKEVRIEAVHGLSDETNVSAYRIGEAVTGKVVETGKAAVITRVSREPLFPNRFERWNVTKQELSFICVPISIGDKVVGTLSVDRPFDEDAPLDEEVRILEIVAMVIANGLQARHEAAVERRALAEENQQLRRQLDEQRPTEDLIGDPNVTLGAGSFKDTVNSFERDLIITALKRCNGNVSAAARVLNATPRVIRYRVKELGIDYERYCSKKG